MPNRRHRRRSPRRLLHRATSPLFDPPHPKPGRPLPEDAALTLAGALTPRLIASLL